MITQKYRIILISLFFGFFSACTNPEPSNKKFDLEKIRANDTEKIISYVNAYYDFVFSVPKDWKIEIADTKSGGYSITNEELNFSFSTHGFAPFKIKNLQFSTEIMWEELNPAGIKFIEKGNFKWENYESYYVGGKTDDEQNYLFVVTCYDKVLKKDFVMILKIINQSEKVEKAREILQSIRKA